MLLPVAKLWAMSVIIKTLWLANNEWVWEGNKFPCKCNGFSEMVFMAALQGFFYFVESFILWDFTVYLKKKSTEL